MYHKITNNKVIDLYATKTKSMVINNNHSESEIAQIKKSISPRGNMIPSNDMMHDWPQHKKGDKYGA